MLVATKGSTPAPFHIGGLPAPPPPAAPVTVLMVDDDSFQHEVIKGLFEQANQNQSVRYELSIVSTAEEALELLRDPSSLKPDIILLDIIMDGISGTELLPDVRRHGQRTPT